MRFLQETNYERSTIGSFNPLLVLANVVQSTEKIIRTQSVLFDSSKVVVVTSALQKAHEPPGQLLCFFTTELGFLCSPHSPASVEPSALHVWTCAYAF